MMKSPFDVLAELNEIDETARIEAKDSRRGDVGKSVFHTLSAFSNEPGLDGGYLLFGVERGDDGQYRPVGVSDPDKLQSDLSSMCSEFNVPIRPNIEVEKRDDACLVLAFIPEADISVKPVYRKASGLNDGAFRRNGSTDVKCSENDLQALFSDRSGHDYERRDFEDASIDHFDADAIATYRKVLQGRDSDAGLVDWSDEKLLSARECLRMVDDTLRPTVSGLILFGTKQALERWMWMSSRIDYIRVYGRDWSSSADSMTSQKFWGPLVLTIPKIVDAIVGELPQRMTFPSDAIKRREEAYIPRFTLREAVVNAVMHRDYRQNSSVQIIRYTDRIEIRNPGRSLKPVQRLGEVGSKLRNPNLAHILYQLEFAEAMGSGVGRIKDALKERHLPAPEFESQTASDEFMLTLNFDAAIDEPIPEVGKEFTREPVSADPESGSSEAQSGGSEAQSGGSETQSGGSEAQSGGLKSSLLDELPELQALTLGKLGARIPQRVMQNLIRDLCTLRPYRPVELAVLLERSRDYITQNYLTPMVKDGQLERTHPETPGHPKQAYRTIETDSEENDG